MKKFASLLLAVVLTFGIVGVAFAAPASTNANTGPGVAQVQVSNDVSVRIGGNGNSARLIAYVGGEQAFVSADRPANNAVTTLSFYFDGVDYVVAVTVRGNSIVDTSVVSATVREVVVPGCADDCDCPDCVCDCGDCALCPEPIVVRLGFIGYYFHSSRCESLGPMSTSIHWQTLNEGDTIDWAAVEAAYADWVAKGGLVPDTAAGWRSSGFAPISFDDGAAIGYGDFAFPQLEGFYRAYFVTPGFLLPVYVCSDICDECGNANCDDCALCDCPPAIVDVTATAGLNLNIQNNQTVRVTIVVDGEAVVVDVLNANNSGNRNFTFAGGTGFLTVNGNNVVTGVSVTGVGVESVSAVRLRASGNQQ